MPSVRCEKMKRHGHVKRRRRRKHKHKNLRRMACIQRSLHQHPFQCHRQAHLHESHLRQMLQPGKHQLWPLPQA